MTENELLARIEYLETQQAFQEDALETLNQTITKLQFDHAKLKEQMALMSNRLVQIQPSLIAHESEETPPPHY